MHERKVTAIAIAMLLASTTAEAAPFFTDDFEGSTPALDTAPPGWRVTEGTVDIAGPGLDAFLCGGSGTCVDLDGSTADAGILERSFGLRGGTRYVLGFDLAGNRRSSGLETGHVRFGDARLDYALDDSQVQYQRFSLAYTPMLDGDVRLLFANDGGDLGGAILDNVRIDADPAMAVPGPSPAPLLAIAALAILAGRHRVRSRLGS
jgi:hypothetical protein